MAENCPENKRPEIRSKAERARDEMSPDVYEQLLAQALELVLNG